MSGRAKQKVYLYDENGSYLQDFESISDFADYVGIQQNVFSNYKKREIHILEDGRVASLSRIGRDFAMKYKRYKASHYTVEYPGRNISESRKNGKREVEVITLDEEVVAVFKNSYFYKKMTGKFGAITIPSKKWSNEGLKIRYR